MVRVEQTTKPWFGPRRRARTLLAEHRRGEPVGPSEALQILGGVLGGIADGITNARFVDYVNKRDQFRYTIMVLWTESDERLRQDLYDRGSEIVARSGWYPLPMGERLRSVESANRRRDVAEPGGLPAIRGSFLSIESAVPPEGGCSVRVTTTEGDSLLLDAALPGQLDTAATDRVVLLSHAHADHAGGITSERVGSLPLVMTQATANAIDRNIKPGTGLRRTIVRHGQRIALGSLQGEAFLVPHLPGASGWILRDGTDSLIFTGDINLRTSRHDFIPVLTAIARQELPGDVTVLLDATMAGRSAGASDADAGAQIITALATFPEIVLVAQAADSLLYAYLDLFHTVQQSADRHTVSFLATERLRSHFKELHHAFITRDAEMLDPFLLAQYGSTMSAWGESRWLYWVSSRRRPKVSARRIWLLTVEEFMARADLHSVPCVQIGRESALPSFTRLDVDSTPWTGHSNEVSLSDGCRALVAEGVRVVLFHNFSKRIKKFVRDADIDAVPLSGTVDLEA